MDELDRRLMMAWAEVGPWLRDNPAEGVKRMRKALGPTLARPLRSWSLVLRADDKRIAGENPGNGDDDFVWLDAAVVRCLCSPVRIDWPGVSVGEAARLLGVNKTTVYRWSRRWVIGSVGSAGRAESAGSAEIPPFAPGSVLRTGVDARAGDRAPRLWRDVYVNRADRKRDVVRVWAPAPVEPGGEVWSMDWGTLRQSLTKMMPDDFAQALRRHEQRCGGRAVVRRWTCPECRASCGKLYLPMPVWTIAAALGAGGAAADELAAAARRPMRDGFACHRCAGLIYESAERTSRPARGRHVNVWDRFVKRISAGMLRGREVAGEH